MQWNPYLFFDGQCEKAFKFYQNCFGGNIVAMVPYADMPGGEPMAPEHKNLIMHARLVAGNQVLMGADAHPSQPNNGVHGFSVALHTDTPAEAERLFNALAENGTIVMPVQQTFWAERFGMLTDQFGIPWMINCEKPR